MSSGPHRFGPGSWPETLPIFPLNGVLLLPHGRLPLNIFEPRYLAMAEDALAGDRLIGMVQPLRADVESPSGTPEVYSVGCAGRIVSFSESDDGRYLITLLGISRFRIERELETVQGYRRVVPGFEAFASDLAEEPGTGAHRERLIRALGAYLELKGIRADWKEIETASDHALVTAMAMICPFQASEKQALLESPGLEDRGELLTALMEMAVHEARGPAATH